MRRFYAGCCHVVGYKIADGVSADDKIRFIRREFSIDSEVDPILILEFLREFQNKILIPAHRNVNEGAEVENLCFLNAISCSRYSDIFA